VRANCAGRIHLMEPILQIPLYFLSNITQGEGGLTVTHLVDDFTANSHYTLAQFYHLIPGFQHTSLQNPSSVTSTSPSHRLSRTWEEANITMLVATRPPFFRDSFNISDPITLAESKFVILRCVIAITRKQESDSTLQGIASCVLV